MRTWLTYRRLAVGFLLVTLPVCALGLLRFRSNMEDVLQWLPDSSREREVYNDFVRRFGVDDFVVVSWPDCDLHDRRADALSAALRASDNPGLIDDSRSGRELIAQLNQEARLPIHTVISRFRGFYFGRDSNQTCVIVSLTKHGMMNRKAAMSHIAHVADSVLGDTARQLVIGGYPQVGAYGDQVIRQSVFRLVGPSCLLSTLAAWYCLRSLRATLAILAVSGIAAALSIAMVTLTGALWGGLSSAIPTLAYIMTVSGAVHLVNYARRVTGPHVARQVLAIGWRPCLFSAVTTAAGMLSLCRSEFPAVREFGAHCAAGVLGAVACQLILIPVALEWLKVQRQPTATRHWQDGLLSSMLRCDRQVVVVFAAIGVVSTCGLLSLHANLDVERNFRRNTTVMRDIGWLERCLGPLEQTECVLRFPDASPDRFVERMKIVGDVEAALRALPVVHGVLSLVDSLPEEPTGGGVRRTVARTLYRRFVNGARAALQESAYLSVGPSDEAWRISLRVPFLGDTDFIELERQVRVAAANALSRHPTSSVDVDYTGVSHLYHVTQRAVIADLYWNFGTAFLLICPFMIVAVRSLTLGGLAMIPNVCPALVVFGTIGLVGYPIDIGIAMTASVALGIAVDDTTHLLIRFCELRKRSSVNPAVACGSGLNEAVRVPNYSLAALSTAYHQCAAAMLQTTMIAGVGLSLFIGGPLVAMTRFATVLIATLLVALICNLTLLPALLSRCRFVSFNAEP